MSDSKHHEFYSTEFSPRWIYHLCSHCRRAVTSVIVMRGTHSNSLRCTSLPGHPANGCAGMLVEGTERKMVDWPMRARHDADFEWYRPEDEKELRQIKRHAPKLYEYLIAGGLMMRAASPVWKWTFGESKNTESRMMHDVPPMDENVKRCPFDGNPLNDSGECPIHGDPYIDPGYEDVNDGGMK